MTTAQTEGLTAMLTVLGLLVLLALPSVIGIVRDRRVDRQIREAQRAHSEVEELRPADRPTRRQPYFTTTVTHHS